ncbi:MAG TPA: phospholipase D-like domain-containing protein [Anaerolineales bacterium]|nr:phospholipase D-like domain-containing protein [Anaerolineales bacterium]
MRNRITQSGLTVNAIAGSHVVILGMDLSAAARAGCLGFAIQREDHIENERYWMRGMKTFQATDPGLGPGGTISSREHPFQSFQWMDYSAKPGYRYTYTVVPLYGTPAQLNEGDEVSVDILTETETGAVHSAWFNRGAVASQEYARRFQNRPPDEVPNQAAYKWLSRGLLEALLTFIGRASDSSWSIHGAVYEFEWSQVLLALKAAARAGAKVRIVYDGIPGGTGPARKNENAVKLAKIKGLSTKRTQGKLMHNKFFVLSKDGQPLAVWTGSTNITENGLFGHSNLGHLIEDSTVAQAYLDYWHRLKRDAPVPDMRSWIGSRNPAPPEPWNQSTTAVFSPRSGLGVLDWYAAIANSAQQALFMTFAFGMHDKFQRVYEQNDGILRFALMEKEGHAAGLEQAKKDIRRIRRLPNIVVAVGNTIAVNSFDRWLKERSKLSHEVNVRFVHTKYALIDPLGDHPVVVTGSANFSPASTNTNDENMIVIRDDKRVADIYLGEFMRLYSHYAFREAVKIAKERGEDPDDWQPNFLIADDTWQQDYFTMGHQRFFRRCYFAGA